MKRIRVVFELVSWGKRGLRWLSPLAHARTAKPAPWSVKALLLFLLSFGIGHPIYLSLFLVFSSVWTFAATDYRPFASLGLTVHRRTAFLFSLGFILGSGANIASDAATIHFQMGLKLEWPFLAAFDYASPAELIGLAWKTFIPPLYEELLFRGAFLQTLLGALGSVPAVLVSSITFGIAHFTRYDWAGVLGTGVSGLVYAVAYLKTRNLWLPVGLHFGWNLVARYGAEWGLYAFPTADHPWREELLAAGNPFYILANLLVLLIVLVLPLRPHPKDKVLSERYIHPAPWPLWRKPRPLSWSARQFTIQQKEHEGT